MTDSNPKHKLSIVSKAPRGLGVPTIMDPGLAARYGTLYVELTALAIDIDRIRIEIDESDALPFGAEVFLLEHILVSLIDPSSDVHIALIEESCLFTLERAEAAGGDVLGGQWPFAVDDAVARGLWPAAFRRGLNSWRAEPSALRQALSALWNEAAQSYNTLSELCLDISLDPPLAPSSRRILETAAT